MAMSPDVITIRINNKFPTGLSGVPIEELRDAVAEEAEFYLMEQFRFSPKFLIESAIEQYLENWPDSDLHQFSPGEKTVADHKMDVEGLFYQNILLNDVVIHEDTIDLITYFAAIKKKPFASYRVVDGSFQRVAGRLPKKKSILEWAAMALELDWHERYLLTPESFRKQFPICETCGSMAFFYDGKLICKNPKCSRIGA